MADINENAAAESTEITDSFIAAVKTALRIKHDKLDDDVRHNISAALLDLSRVGIDTNSGDDIILNACILYCKQQYNYLGKSDLWEKNYSSLIRALSLSCEYRKGDGGNV